MLPSAASVAVPVPVQRCDPAPKKSVPRTVKVMAEHCTAENLPTLSCAQPPRPKAGVWIGPALLCVLPAAGNVGDVTIGAVSIVSWKCLDRAEAAGASAALRAIAAASAAVSWTGRRMCSPLKADGVAVNLRPSGRADNAPAHAPAGVTTGCAAS